MAALVHLGTQVFVCLDVVEFTGTKLWLHVACGLLPSIGAMQVSHMSRVLQYSAFGALPDSTGISTSATRLACQQQCNCFSYARFAKVLAHIVSWKLPAWTGT